MLLCCAASGSQPFAAETYFRKSESVAAITRRNRWFGGGPRSCSCSGFVGAVAALSLLLISAPVISQRFPAGREPDYRGEKRCGPASVAMVARGFHRRPQLSDAALIETLDRVDDGVENRATTPAGIVRMAEALRLRAQMHAGFDGAWLRRVLKRGGLVVALGRPRYLPPTEAHTGGHFVSIVGVTRSGAFVVNDSYRRHGRSGRRYRVAEPTLASFVRHKPNGTLFAIYAARK